MDYKLPFGLKNGNTLVHISEVESGIKCECVCPSCHHPLVAKKGPKTAHHFAHYKSKECEYGLETAIHLAAKEVLERHRKMVIPKVILGRGANRQKNWTIPQKEIRFDEVKLENYHQGVVPDVLVYAQGKPLMIEITVTHKTGEEKIQKVREQGISILEINLEHFERKVTLEDLEKEVIYNISNKNWLLNLKAEKIRSLANQYSERVICDMDGNAFCPIKKTNLNNDISISWMHDCSSCEYCVDIINDDRAGTEYDRKGFPISTKIGKTVFCLGKRGIKSFKELVRLSLIP